MRRSMGDLPDGYNYAGMEDYVLDRAVKPISAPLTEREYKILFAAVDNFGKRFQLKQCFYNAQMLLVCDHTGLIEYHEGFARGLTIPVHHGWASINGKVIDLTWHLKEPRKKGRLRNRVLGEIPEGWEYVGVAFPRDRVIKRIYATEMAGSLIDDYENGWPCLREPRQEA